MGFGNRCESGCVTEKNINGLVNAIDYNNIRYLM